MSQHFKMTLAAIVATVALLLVVGAWLQRTLERDIPAIGHIRAAARSLTLSPKDKEMILYNSASHILTVVTSSHTTTQYTRNPVIHFQKDGQIGIDRHVFEFECSPYIGAGYSDRFTTYLGLNLVDAWRFDGGIAMAYSPGVTRPLLVVGYNVFGNVSLNVGLDTRKDVNGFVSVKFW